jgi:secondary thiamine-phosphate synthase enzyme
MRLTTSEVTVCAASKRGFVDVTEDLIRAVKDSGVTHGLATIFCRHTTCGLLINEWEDGALEDLQARFESLAPGAGYYAHDDPDLRSQNLDPSGDERRNGDAHVIQMLLANTAQVVPVMDGEVALGRWQRLFLVELDEPKDRSVLIQVMGE